MRNFSLFHYNRKNLAGDLSAGVVVAIMLVPQSMAYAMLAGMPPETGLYASIFPLIIYALTGSSNYLAVGPVAIVALMVRGIVGEFAEPGSDEYLALAIMLSMLTGAVLILFGLLRFGVFANFLSHSVMTGFINAAALIITVSQLRYLFGLDALRHEGVLPKLMEIFSRLDDINPVTTTIGICAILLLLLPRTLSARLLVGMGLSDNLITIISKTGALAVVSVAALCVWLFGLHEHAGVEIVGQIPGKLPILSGVSIDMDMALELLPAATLIAFVGYLESISVARSLASKRRERIEPNREFLSLGLANIVSSLSGTFPVAGGFGRSVVNFHAGARTQLASIITALLIGVTLMLLAPLFFYLPKAVLSAIVILAVLRLIELQPLLHTWRYNRADWLSMVITFITVLIYGVEIGILAGFTVSIALYLWRTANPHIAVVGRVDDTEHYRNVMRHNTRTCAHVRAVRIDESLYFANAHALEDKLLSLAAEEQVTDIVLICSAVNFIDASALDTLEATLERLRDSSVTLHLAEVKGPVMDKLKLTAFLQHLAPGKIYLSTHAAMTELNCI